jgi:hypothetical protein
MFAALLGCAVSSGANARLRWPGPRATAAADSTVAQPQLVYLGRESFTVRQQRFVRYRFDVANKSRFPDELFMAAPSLPACGNNARASRTWVDFFTRNGQRLYGFCAMQRAADLGTLWFALPEGQAPPAQVYIEMRDRAAGYTYRSGLAAIDSARQAPTPAQAAPPLVLNRDFMVGRWTMPRQTCVRWIRFDNDNGFTTWRGAEGAWHFGSVHRDELTARDIASGETVLSGIVRIGTRFGAKAANGSCRLLARKWSSVLGGNNRQ